MLASKPTSGLSFVAMIERDGSRSRSSSARVVALRLVVELVGERLEAVLRIPARAAAFHRTHRSERTVRVKKIYTVQNVLSFLLAAVLASKGPTSSEQPYVVPIASKAFTMSVLTVGDSVNGYRMIGKPDGLGAYDNGDGTFTLAH
jgi:hypothetical protein